CRDMKYKLDEEGNLIFTDALGNCALVVNSVELPNLRQILPSPQPTQSPAIQLLNFAWKHCGSYSWRNLNHTMIRCLKIAIECGMEFAEGDFLLMVKSRSAGGFSFDFWGGQDNAGLGEGFYTLACTADAGCNTSACIAFEKYKGRKPFILKDDD